MNALLERKTVAVGDGLETTALAEGSARRCDTPISLEEQARGASGETTRDRQRGLLTEARQALDRGDYETAGELLDVLSGIWKNAA